MCRADVHTYAVHDRMFNKQRSSVLEIKKDIQFRASTEQTLVLNSSLCFSSFHSLQRKGSE